MRRARPREAGAVSVDIYDEVYHLRGTDAEYIEQLAGLVDAKMRAVAAHSGTVDSLRVAVLAALNIADELLALRKRYDALAGSAGRTENSMRRARGRWRACWTRCWKTAARVERPVVGQFEQNLTSGAKAQRWN